MFQTKGGEELKRNYVLDGIIGLVVADALWSNR
jgi:hypothetical protein